MKNQILKVITFCYLLILVSCGDGVALEPPTSNRHYKNIIGIPIKSKIGNLEVTQYDFPEQMNWLDAKEACDKLGKGWRLPNREQIEILYLNKDKIGGFKYIIKELKEGCYWSSEEYVNNDDERYAWFQYFTINNRSSSQSNSPKDRICYVRAIRTN